MAGLASATGTGAPAAAAAKAAPMNGAVASSADLFSVYKPKVATYTDTSIDPEHNHHTLITPDKVQERVGKKYNKSPGVFSKGSVAEKEYDAVIIGGGHNGLVTAGYLAKKGLSVLVLERRHVVGGAAITEEIVPGFKFSRASYLAGLLRPTIIKDLELEKYGFEYLPRDPSSFTPTLFDSPSKGKYLLLGSDAQKTYDSIAQFSVKDAENMPKYDDFLGKVRDIVSPMLDAPPPDLTFQTASEGLDVMKVAYQTSTAAREHADALAPFYELFTAPAAQILDRWFEGDVLKVRPHIFVVLPTLLSIVAFLHAVDFLVLIHCRAFPSARLSPPAGYAGDGRRHWRCDLPRARGLCVRAPASRHGRGSGQEGRVGVRARRHGRSHAGDGAERAQERRTDRDQRHREEDRLRRGQGQGGQGQGHWRRDGRRHFHQGQEGYLQCDPLPHLPRAAPRPRSRDRVQGGNLTPPRGLCGPHPLHRLCLRRLQNQLRR